MNRKNIDNSRYVDLDEIIMMVIEPMTYLDNEQRANQGFKVDGVSKQGFQIPSLFVAKNEKGNIACEEFILKNWVNAKK